MKNTYDLIIIGGGAAGIFGALSAKEGHPHAKILVLEKTTHLLNKVRISGGGRCNVTHACFDPRKLVLNYPRGERALIGPFHRFQAQDTINWFEVRGVELKIEDDGRMFPISNSSQTIIDCLLLESKQLGIDIRTKQSVENVEVCEEGFRILLSTQEPLICKKLLLATGNSPVGHKFAQALGHSVISPVPSLFTFNIPDSPLHDLSGITIDKVKLKLADTQFEQMGPLLITHWGFSGPAALKLSAWAARFLSECQYQVKLKVDWLPQLSHEELFKELRQRRQVFSNQTILSDNFSGLPKNLWRRLLEVIGIDAKKRWAEGGNETLECMREHLKAWTFQVNGKTTNKEEFVTCGGVVLNEIDFKTMQSRKCPGLYFAGEILDIDAVTGGFNFQNAWTTGYIAGQESLN